MRFHGLYFFSGFGRYLSLLKSMLFPIMLEHWSVDDKDAKSVYQNGISFSFWGIKAFIKSSELCGETKSNQLWR